MTLEELKNGIANRWTRCDTQSGELVEILYDEDDPEELPWYWVPGSTEPHVTVLTEGGSTSHCPLTSLTWSDE